jgi:hypothetical protein
VWQLDGGVKAHYAQPPTAHPKKTKPVRVINIPPGGTSGYMWVALGGVVEGVHMDVWQAGLTAVKPYTVGSAGCWWVGCVVFVGFVGWGVVVVGVGVCGGCVRGLGATEQGLCGPAPPWLCFTLCVCLCWWCVA